MAVAYPAIDTDRTWRRIHRLSRLLDESFRIPGTRYRIGLDPLLGLLPGIGDLAGVAGSLYILAQAKRLGAPDPLMARMAVNVAIDALIGAIPLVGDVFDFGWKGNLRNARLLSEHMGLPWPPPKRVKARVVTRRRRRSGHGGLFRRGA